MPEDQQRGGSDAQHSHPAESSDDQRLQDNLTPEQRSQIGRKGGEAVSQDREHMSEIGRKGGESVSQDREHMAEIGKKGGESLTPEEHARAGSQSHKND